MASIISAQILLPTHPKPQTPQLSLPTRRQFSSLLLLTATTTALTAAVSPPSKAQDIPLFGLRKNLKKAEEEAELIVKEGFEAAEQGIESTEKEIETAVSFGGLAQAGAVVGAEVLGVLVATSVVNGILGPEAQKS